MNKIIESLRGSKQLIVEENKERFLFRARNGSGSIVKLPKSINSDICFLTGIIIGDGTISKCRFRITIEMVSKNIMELVKSFLARSFQIDAKLKKVIDKRPNRQLRWKIEINSKPLWLFFSKVLDIPIGKKSDRVVVPSIIFSNNENLRMFVSGLFLADGGLKSQNSIAFSFSNPFITNQISNILVGFGISNIISQWKRKNENKVFFDVIIRKEDAKNKFKETFPLVLLKLNS